MLHPQDVSDERLWLRDGARASGTNLESARYECWRTELAEKLAQDERGISSIRHCRSLIHLVVIVILIESVFVAGNL